MNPEQNKQIPSPLISSIPVVVLVAMLFIVIRHFGSDTLEGGSQISLMVATFVCVFIAILFYKQRWQDLENAIAANMRVVTVGIVILLLIGAVAGTGGYLRRQGDSGPILSQCLFLFGPGVLRDKAGTHRTAKSISTKRCSFCRYFRPDSQQQHHRRSPEKIKFPLRPIIWDRSA